MDNRPIGIFDSGLGGLTTVKRLTELMPRESIIYLGDTGRVPYGSRSRETIIKYARQDAAFLLGHSIKAMVIACNTVCSSATVRDVFGRSTDIGDIPVFEVISAPARAAAHRTRNGRIGVIGTKATIRSGAYEAAIKSISPDAHVTSAACPLFVPMVEDGVFSANDVAALSIAERYLAGLRTAGVDTLLLGCTHYPLLRDVIEKAMGPDVELIDSGSETAKLVSKELAELELQAQDGASASMRYFVTDSVDGFEMLASRFLERDVSGMVEQTVLDQ